MPPISSKGSAKLNRPASDHRGTVQDLRRVVADKALNGNGARHGPRVGRSKAGHAVHAPQQRRPSHWAFQDAPLHL